MYPVSYKIIEKRVHCQGHSGHRWPSHRPAFDDVRTTNIHICVYQCCQRDRRKIPLITGALTKNIQKLLCFPSREFRAIMVVKPRVGFFINADHVKHCQSDGRREHVNGQFINNIIITFIDSRAVVYGRVHDPYRAEIAIAGPSIIFHQNRLFRTDARRVYLLCGFGKKLHIYTHTLYVIRTRFRSRVWERKKASAVKCRIKKNRQKKKNTCRGAAALSSLLWDLRAMGRKEKSAVTCSRERKNEITRLCGIAYVWVCEFMSVFLWVCVPVCVWVCVCMCASVNVCVGVWEWLSVC